MKRIIICADGTWNDAEIRNKKTGKRKPTNVLKISRAILPSSSDGVTQVVYYHEGVGTNGGLDKMTGGAFGKGMEENVRALYRFLVLNYELGDELYFFGFSRGAFTVRTLAGFMNAVGLLEKDDEFYTPELYQLYESEASSDSGEWKHAFRNISNHRPCPQIKCIGVWDTVGSLGAPGVLGQLLNRNKFKYHDVALNDYIQNAFHALAIDELRKPFKPSLWKKPQNWSGALEQAWFAGVHSNVGGGYHPDGMANEPLHWMVEKAETLGLEFDSQFLDKYIPCFNSLLVNSMTPKYHLLGKFERKLGKHINDGEKLHQSALDRKNLAECKYEPTNLDENIPVVNTTRISRGTPCPPL